MTLGYDDVMFLLRLLLGTGQRILLEVQAVEPLRLAGAAGEGGGREGKQSHAELLLPQPSLHTPQSLLQKGPWGPPCTLGPARQSSFGPGERPGASLPNRRKH